jgi:glycerol uptake facilitator-like aquaporin
LFFAAHRLPGKIILLYITSQSLGAVVASALLRALFPQHPTLGTTAPSGAATQSLALQIVLTALQMFVILNVPSQDKWGRIFSLFFPSPILEGFFRPPTGSRQQRHFQFEKRGKQLVSGHDVAPATIALCINIEQHLTG